MTFLASYSVLTFDHSLGGTFDRDPRAVVWHTTEGTSVAGAVGVYQTKLAAPHLTVDFDTKEKYQHVPLNRSSYALQNLQAGCQTNTTGVIQVEVVARAAETWAWSQERLKWLGEEVLRPIFDACPSIPRGPVYTGPRMTCPEWDVWSGGQCGHVHVPENDHWDPGDLDLKQIVAYATGDDMPLTDAEIEKIAKAAAEAVVSRPLDIEGHTASLANWIGFLYAQVTRPDLLEKRIADAVAKHAILVDDPGVP